MEKGARSPRVISRVALSEGGIAGYRWIQPDGTNEDDGGTDAQRSA